MIVRVAVVDPLPLFRQGVVAVLSAAGVPAEAPGDVLSWARHQEAAAVLLTMTERAWDLLENLRAEPPLVIALIENGSAVQGVRAVRGGARSVLAREVSAEALRRSITATLDGQAVLLPDVLAMLAAGTPDGPGSFPSPDQMTWLRGLAEGATVAQVAVRSGYSERAMFRLLQGLYREMGVSGRVPAIMRAQQAGWLEAGKRS